MAKLYVSRFRVSDSLGILKTFEDGDVQSVDFDLNNMIAMIQGMSLQTRATTGYVLGNLELSFGMNVFVRAEQKFKDIMGLWDYSTAIKVSFDAAFVQSFQTLGTIKFLGFTDVVPKNSTLSASDSSTAATVQYQFQARDYDVG